MYSMYVQYSIQCQLPHTGNRSIYSTDSIHSILDSFDSRFIRCIGTLPRHGRSREPAVFRVGHFTVLPQYLPPSTLIYVQSTVCTIHTIHPVQVHTCPGQVETLWSSTYIGLLPSPSLVPDCYVHTVLLHTCSCTISTYLYIYLRCPKVSKSCIHSSCQYYRCTRIPSRQPHS